MGSISFYNHTPILAKTDFTKSNSRHFLTAHKKVLASKFNLQKQPKCLKPFLVAALKNPSNDPNRNVDFMPSSDLVHKFYALLNSKDVRRLEKLFDKDCVIEDEAYYRPLAGKKIHEFFEKLTKAMGQHVVFKIDEFFEGDNSKITVMWHLEWNGEIIPFTKGCSLFLCSQKNDTILIKKAHVFVESPLKPGDFALDMLKIVVALFDRFPQFATSFLQKHDAIVYYLLKIYKVLVEPFLVPIIMYYTRILTYGAKVLSILLNIINNIIKMFF